MQKSIITDCPTYLELGLKNGEVYTVNGKALTNEGIQHVIGYLCEEVNVKVEDVLSKVKATGQNNGAVTLKLHNGAVSTF